MGDICILNFNHTYENQDFYKKKDYKIIDLYDLKNVSRYCDEKTLNIIRKKLYDIENYKIKFIDSGNYHYISYLILEKIKKPFVLVLFDHHTDMQQPLMEGMMSCGDWAGMVLDQNPALQQFILIGPAEDDIKQIRTKHLDKLITFSAEEIRKGEGVERLKRIHGGVPLYISIDKDVLSEQYSETNWNQGELTLGMLEHMLQYFLERAPVYGIDICGECSTAIALPEYFQAEGVNGKTNVELFRFLRSYCCS